MRRSEVTARQLSARQRFLVAFLGDHSTKMLSGEAHERRGLSSSQRVVMAASSVCYLACAATWRAYSYVNLARCFGCVCVLSVGADSLGGVVLPERVMRPLRVADRAVGTVSLLCSVLFNMTSIVNSALTLAAVLSSLCFLAKGRAVAKAEPAARWKYLAYHGLWHAYGAAVLCAVTVRAQAKER